MNIETENSGKSQGYIIRGIATVAAVMLYGWINFLLSSISTLASGKLAVKQFENSDSAYISSLLGMRFFHDLGIPSLVLFAVLLWVWWKPIKSCVRSSRGGAAICLLVMLMGSSQALAYYDKQDFTEAYFILPNESAFFIPDVGANKDSQGQFGSEAYLRENKIAAKRYIIPHTKLSGSGTWSDFYVPTGRLIIVDRTPYNREWVSASTRGTSTRNEAIPCQSSEGLNITAEISIATSVLEENSPRYLYRFGVRPPVGDRTKPEVIFTSVFYSRSLAEVMDSVGRGKVQALVCSEISSRTLDAANKEAPAVIANVEKNAKSFFEAMGITLDYLGWAGTFTFDQQVQDAINRRYVAAQDVEVAKTLAPYTSTIQALASADALRAFANKSDGKLPTNVSLWWLPTSLSDVFSNLLKPAPETAAPKKAEPAR